MFLLNGVLSIPTSVNSYNPTALREGQYIRVSISGVKCVLDKIITRPESMSIGVSDYTCVLQQHIIEPKLESSKGKFIKEVTSIERNTYPNNGEQNGVWYVYKGIE